MKKDSARITLDIRKLPEGYYLATSTDVQGLIAQGKTFEETIEIARDVAAILIKAERKNNNARMEYSTDHIVYPMAVRV